MISNFNVRTNLNFNTKIFILIDIYKESHFLQPQLPMVCDIQLVTANNSIIYSKKNSQSVQALYLGKLRNKLRSEYSWVSNNLIISNCNNCLK